jgi:enterochelin esterase-like enzyme
MMGHKTSILAVLLAILFGMAACTGSATLTSTVIAAERATPTAAAVPPTLAATTTPAPSPTVTPVPQVFNGDFGDLEPDDGLTPTRRPTVTPTATTKPLQRVPGRFYSTITDEYYTTYVRLPRGYDPQADTVYPIVYLLDAQWYWNWLPGMEHPDGGAASLIPMLSDQGRIPPVILVGIHTGSNLDQRHNTLVLDSHLFYAFLANELIPYLDAHYRTDLATPRTLVGHSDGCYFVLYALFRYGLDENPLFGYYLGLSGDHSQTEGRNFFDEQRLFDRIGQGGKVNAALYLAWGDSEEERFTTSNAKLTELLQSRDYQGFRLKSVALKGRDHAGTAYPGIKSGLVWVFGE